MATGPLRFKNATLASTCGATVLCCAESVHFSWTDNHVFLYCRAPEAKPPSLGKVALSGECSQYLLEDL